MEDPVDKADAGALVGVLVWQLDVDFPVSPSEWCCTGEYGAIKMEYELMVHTFFGSLEADVELLPKNHCVRRDLALFHPMSHTLPIR